MVQCGRVLMRSLQDMFEFRLPYGPLETFIDHGDLQMVATRLVSAALR